MIDYASVFFLFLITMTLLRISGKLKGNMEIHQVVEVTIKDTHGSKKYLRVDSIESVAELCDGCLVYCNNTVSEVEEPIEYVLSAMNCNVMKYRGEGEFDHR